MTAGFWQLRRAAREIRKLKQTLSYFVGMFLQQWHLVFALTGLQYFLHCETIQPWTLFQFRSLMARSGVTP